MVSHMLVSLAHSTYTIKSTAYERVEYLHMSITGDGALNDQSGRIHAHTQITSVKMDKPIADKIAKLTVKRLMPLSMGFLRMLLAIAPNVVKFQYMYNQKNKTVGGIQKVATKRGKFKDYMNKIKYSIELGFPSFAMHETGEGKLCRASSCIQR